MLYKKQSLLGRCPGTRLLSRRDPGLYDFCGKIPESIGIGSFLHGLSLPRVIQSLSKGEKGMREESALALSLSGMFGLGMVLKSYITGNPHFAKASQSGLKTYIFGSAAFLQKEDIILIALWSLFSLSLFLLFQRALQLYCFDPDYGAFLGIEEKKMQLLLQFFTDSPAGPGH